MDAMQTRLIHSLARQHYDALHRDAELRRPANTADREQSNALAVITTALSDLLGHPRTRLPNRKTRPEPAADERRAEAFPLWQAARARLAQAEAGVAAVEETIQAGVAAVEETIEAGVAAVEETIGVVPDTTSDLA